MLPGFVCGAGVRVDGNRARSSLYSNRLGLDGVCGAGWLTHEHVLRLGHKDILVAEDGTVKVLDFGIAAVLRTDVTRITATGSPVGTNQYMAPEQVQGGRVTPKATSTRSAASCTNCVAGGPCSTGTARTS